MKKRTSRLTVWLLVMLMSFGCFFTNVSGASVEPTTTDKNNPTIEGYVMFKEDEQGRELKSSGTYTDGTATVTLTFDETGKFVDWESDVPISYVLVKGGNQGGYMYHYSPAETSDVGLRAPDNTNDKKSDDKQQTMKVEKKSGVALQRIGNPDSNQSGGGPPEQGDDPQPTISHVTFYYASQENPEAPRLEIEKTASSETVHPGDVVTYSIKVTNSGDRAVSDVVVVETLPVEMDFVADGSDAWTKDGDVYTYTFASLAVGGVETLTFKAAVKSGIKDVEEITNTASVSCENGQCHQEDSVTVTVDYPDDGAVPELAIVKTASPTAVHPGDTVTYTITVTNEGSAEAKNVIVVENLPAYMELPKAGPGDWTEDNGNYTHLIQTLAAGASIPLEFTAVVKSDISEISGITNTASATCDGDEGPNVATATVSVQYPNNETTADLTIVKDVSPEIVYPGYAVTYYIKVTNNGPDNATNVKIIETLPDHMSLPDGGAPGWIQEDSNFYKIIDNLEAGESETVEFNAMVNSNISEITKITNTAMVNCTEDETLKTATADITIQYQQNPSLPAFAIKKEADKERVSQGDIITYTITVTNNGGYAEGAEIHESLPYYTNLADDNPSGWHFIPDTGEYSYSLGELARGESKSAKFKVKVSSDSAEVPYSIGNTATTWCPGTNRELQDSVVIPLITEAVKQKPAISKTDNGISAHPGDIVTYHFTIDPNDYSLEGAYLIETPDPYTEFESGDGWVEVGTDEAGRTIYRYNLMAEIPRLTAISAPEIPDFKVKVKSTTPRSVTLASNTVTLYYAEEEEPLTAHDTTPIIHLPIDNDDGDDDEDKDDHHDNHPGKPDLVVTKTDNGSVVSPGGLVEYVITVLNKGDSYANGVKVYETLPEWATFVAELNQGWTLVDGKYVYDIGILNAGEKKAIKFVLRVNNPFPEGIDKIVNNIEVKDDGTETATTDNRASDDTPIIIAKPVISEPPVTPPVTPPVIPPVIDPGEKPDLPFTGGMAEVELLFAGMGAVLIGAGLVLKKNK